MNDKLHRSLAYVYSVCSALFLTASLSAQTGPFTQAWVDPIVGSDALGTPSVPPNVSPGRPYRTLNAAISAVSGALPASGEGIVWAQPGIYSAQTNGEILPITMRNGVSVMATGDAKETVIRDTAGVPFFPAFIPDAPRCGSGSGSTNPAPSSSLLVFWSAAGTAGPNGVDFVRPTVLNGFTLQGGDVQVYLQTEVDHYDPRVSNCIFDLRNFDNMDSHPAVGSPRFGLQLVTIWDFGVYPNVPFKVFNNTFVFDTLSASDADANLETVGIVNVNAPCPMLNPQFNDPNDILRGISTMSVQNNLFRITGGNVPMLGVSARDAELRHGIPQGPTNAFPRSNVANRTPLGSYHSAAAGQPFPRVDLSAIPAAGGPRLDPAFAGEFFGSLSPTLDVLDWRLLPSPENAVIDAGGIFDALGRFDSLSGVTYVGSVPSISEPTRRTQHFAWDGEGWGNPRIAGEFADIGYDEADVFLQGASYGESSRSHNVPLDASPLFAAAFPLAAPSGVPAGNPNRISVFPGGPSSATVDYYLTYTPFTGGAWTLPPGIAPVPMTYVGVPGYDWLSTGPNYTLVGAGVPLLPTTYLHTLTGVMHSIQVVSAIDSSDPVPLAPGVVHSNVQVVYHVPGSAPAISNLSREFF